MIRMLPLSFLTMGVSISFCLLVNSFPVLTDQSSLMSSTSISIKVINLLAREQQRLPIGQPPTRDRDIGFASVFLQLENSREEDTALTIQSIEIRDAVTGDIQMLSQTPQTILLRPLEHSINDVHLTNKAGYGECDRVKAIVTYQIADQVQAIETEAVTIEQL